MNEPQPHLPKEGREALIDLLGAIWRYMHLKDIVIEARQLGAEEEREVLELQAIVFDAEQALVKLLASVLGPPEVSYPEDES